MNAFTLSKMYASYRNVSLHGRNLVPVSTTIKVSGKNDCFTHTCAHTHTHSCA